VAVANTVIIPGYKFKVNGDPGHGKHVFKIVIDFPFDGIFKMSVALKTERANPN